MKKQVFNPYLPSYEYIPDGEPRVFDGEAFHQAEITSCGLNGGPLKDEGTGAADFRSFHFA